MPIISSYIVPHPPMIIEDIGRGSEKQIEKTIMSYENVAKEIGEINPDTIIIISPHTNIYNDLFYIVPNKTLKGDFGNFGAYNVEFEEENDIELIEEIEKISEREKIPCKRLEETTLDHGTMVPLYFVRKYLKSCKIIVIGYSFLPLHENYRLGEIIKEAVDNTNKKVVFIASGDLSHKLQEYGPYGFIEEGPIYDEKICSIMKNTKFKEMLEFDENFLEKASECGHRSFTIMAGALNKLNVKSDFLSHEDITGVGYAVCKFYPQEENKERDFRNIYLSEIKQDLNYRYSKKDQYINLARDTIYNYIKYNTIIDIPNNINRELLDNKGAVFVSIHEFGLLRGCIGTILPTRESIAEEIIYNAISAATQDPRFDRIKEEELDYLEINVDLLTTPEKIESKEELNPKKYGVIVKSGYKRGLLLPDLEGIETIDEQIKIAMQKGEISPLEGYELFRFEVIRHKI